MTGYDDIDLDLTADLHPRSAYARQIQRSRVFEHAIAAGAPVIDFTLEDQ